MNVSIMPNHLLGSSTIGSTELVRWTIVICMCMLASFTLSSLRHVQHTLDGHTNQEAEQYLPFPGGMPRVPWVGHHHSSETFMARSPLQDETKTTETTAAAVAAASTAMSSMIRTWQDEPPVCIEHSVIDVNASEERVSDPTKKRLEQTTGYICGKLRRDWRINPPLSYLAQQIAQHQSNCTLPVATNHMDNLFGLGSHVMLWSQSMCNAMEMGFRIRTYQPQWLWLDQSHCDMTQASDQSPMLCYFPSSENHCGNTKEEQAFLRNVSDPRVKRNRCRLVRDNGEELLQDFRAASVEYLFQELGPLIIEEAQRQIGIIFGNQQVPKDLITVHIRWGDKFFEMKLAPVQEYIDAIQRLTQNASTANIYLATEDPKALNEFIQAAPKGWTIYQDITLSELNFFRPPKGNRASWTTRNTKGRAGLVALGSLLVALESNTFVLTTKSNWSALMNYLRTNVIDPRCGNCTRMIDLRPGIW